MRILNKKQLKSWDNFTIKEQGITSLELMERASLALCDWLKGKFNADYSFCIICGPGNNGGDGLALARLLRDAFYKVTVIDLGFSNKRSADNQANLHRLKYIREINYTNLTSIDQFPELDDNTIIVDAIFGYGISKDIIGFYAELISLINELKYIKVSIDIPSGLYVDKVTNGVAVKADYTLSFQVPKLSFFVKENQDRIGQWHLLDIGLSKSWKPENASFTYIDESFARSKFKSRDKFSHKGIFGHVMSYCGSRGMYGAAQLCIKAALRAGAGKVTACIPKSGFDIIQKSIPEAMVIEDDHQNHISKMTFSEGYTYVVGCGIGQSDATKSALMSFLAEAKKAIVLDADALNIISSQKENLSNIPIGSIISPHPGEFTRLFGKSENDFETLRVQSEFSKRFKINIINKGAYTKITDPDGGVYINSTGNPGMATAGSGDVLSGILAGLLAQGYNSLDTCILGIYLHGLAGDLASKEKSESGIIASDLIEYLSKAILKLEL